MIFMKENSNPIISICIPTYKQPKELKRLLESLKLQLTQEIEVLICDDSPDDESMELVLRYNKHGSNIKYFRGSENNVLDRFYQTAQLSNTDIVVLCTGDCPLLDPHLIDIMIEL